ncbi:MAG: DUF2917 domain-containing protein [Pseudomonadota bacterium]
MERIELRHNQPLRLAGPATLECVAGRVWLTTDRTAGDIFLRADERHVLLDGETALVEALGAAVLVCRPSLSRWRRRCRAVISSSHGFVRALRLFRRRGSLAG